MAVDFAEMLTAYQVVTRRPSPAASLGSDLDVPEGRRLPNRPRWWNGKGPQQLYCPKVGGALAFASVHRRPGGPIKRDMAEFVREYERGRSYREPIGEHLAVRTKRERR